MAVVRNFCVFPRGEWINSFFKLETREMAKENNFTVLDALLNALERLLSLHFKLRRFLYSQDILNTCNRW